jgi:Spy/CpxP family protein refolding chaperone
MFRLTILFTVLAVALLLAGPGPSQDKTPAPAAQAPKVKGQLPPLWKNLGLTSEQKEKVYQTRGSYAGKIGALLDQVKKLKTEERTALEQILTDDQKAALRRLLLEKGPKTGAPEVKKSEK